MKDLFLIRHGQAESGPSKMDRDFALTETGRRQAELLGRHLKALGVKPARVYASALTRARETARIVTEHVPAPLEIRRDLIEHGAEVFLHEGPLADAARRFPERVDAAGLVRIRQGAQPGLHWEFAVGGEDLRALHRRARCAWEDLLRLHPEPAGQFLVVAHGSFLAAFVTEALGWPLRPVWNLQLGNCGYVHLRFFSEAGRTWPALCMLSPDGAGWE